MKVSLNCSLKNLIKSVTPAEVEVCANALAEVPSGLKKILTVESLCLRRWYVVTVKMSWLSAQSVQRNKSLQSLFSDKSLLTKEDILYKECQAELLEFMTERAKRMHELFWNRIFPQIPQYHRGGKLRLGKGFVVFVRPTDS